MEISLNGMDCYILKNIMSYEIFMDHINKDINVK